MNRGLFVQGAHLIETWECLTLDHLDTLMTNCFPVAFIENNIGLFSAFPTNIFCDGEIMYTHTHNTKEYLHHKHQYDGGFAKGDDKRIIMDLFFNILIVDEYLSNQNFYINPSKRLNWEFRIDIALSTIIDTIPDKYKSRICHHTTTDFPTTFQEAYPKPEHHDIVNIPYHSDRLASQDIIVSQPECCSEANEQHIQCSNSKAKEQSAVEQCRVALKKAKLGRVSKICLNTLFDRLDGEKIEVLNESHTPKRNTFRDIAEAESIDMQLLLLQFPNLPPLPKISRQYVKIKSRKY